MIERFNVLHHALAVHEFPEEQALFPAVDAIEAGRADVRIEAHGTIDPLRNGPLAALGGQHVDFAPDSDVEARLWMQRRSGTSTSTWRRRSMI